jgi:hypothetical protein
MESNLSADVVDQIDEFSQHQLIKKTDLKTLYHLSVEKGNEKAFEDLSFTAKYVKGLIRVLKTGTSNPDVKSLEHIRKDFTHNMQKVVDQMKELVVNADEQIKTYFDSAYFELSNQSMQNLNLLLSDLEWSKKYFNERKHLNSN